jgi:hypothetical protein
MIPKVAEGREPSGEDKIRQVAEGREPSGECITYQG